jgi:glycosyltransferase involved in cell wall biosynthesis
LINVSVVIPTCNRKTRLLSLLKNLDQSIYPFHEIIVVDSGEDKLTVKDYKVFLNLNIIYANSEKSVCIQRNKGIAIAKSEWIFLCDDDIEVPADYLEKIAGHITEHPEAKAVSGLVLQLEQGKWTAKYHITSTADLLWRYIFNLGIWGEIYCKDNFISRRLKQFYTAKGNHISKAGWPIITDLSGEYFTTPLYGLGASIIKKEWLAKFPYDEILDNHGIGDNYGLSINYPKDSIHILNTAFVYHHHAQENRLQKSLSYYRRILALDYFRRTNKNISHVKKRWLLWSLTGNLLSFILAGDEKMIKAGLKSIMKILFGQNPYLKATGTNRKIVEAV